MGFIAAKSNITAPMPDTASTAFGGLLRLAVILLIYRALSNGNNSVAFSQKLIFPPRSVCEGREGRKDGRKESSGQGRGRGGEGWGGEGGRGVGVRRGDVSSSRTEGIGSRRKILVKRKCAVQKKMGGMREERGGFLFPFFFFFFSFTDTTPGGQVIQNGGKKQVGLTLCIG